MQFGIAQTFLEGLHIQNNYISIRVLWMIDCPYMVKVLCKYATILVDYMFSSDAGKVALTQMLVVQSLMKFEVVLL